MAPSRDAEKRNPVDSEDGEDRLGSLPEGPLLNILSFLPSCEAVRTSLLARRWRNLWKYVRALRVMESHQYGSASQLNAFINHMLLLREPLPLDDVEIKSYHHTLDENEEHSDESFRYIEHWVRYALSHKVQALRVCIIEVEIVYREDALLHWPLPDKLLSSSKLVKLELIGVESENPSLDFSSCPLLKDLRMESCDLLVDRITSSSLAKLNITYCCFQSDGRTRISTPNVLSLHLVDCRERTPLLECMPNLVSAFVRLRYSSDCCAKNYEIGNCGDNSCEGCPGSSNGNIPSILLQGLSCATNLELTAEETVFVFRRDLTCCPVFSKLKTLLLNDWCLTENLEALTCFLQHAPALEKLILQLPEISEDLVKKVGIYGVKEEPFMIKHLTVEIKCCVIDERIGQIVKVLRSYGIPPGKINVNKLPKQITSRTGDLWPSGSLSFEQAEEDIVS